MTEAPEKDPLDMAADEAREIMDRRGTASWSALVGVLQAEAEQAQRRYQLAQRLQAAFAADGGQLPLFPGVVADAPEPKRPRAKRRVLMHEGVAVDGFVCLKCKEVTPIPEDMTAATIKRGIPCPRCNQDAPGITQDENAASEPSDASERARDDK